MAQSPQPITLARRKGQTDVENISEAPHFTKRYTVTLPQNAARVLEWLASGDKEAPEDFIQRALLGHLHRTLTQLDDARAEDLLRNKGIEGSWDWENGEITTVRAAP